MTDQPAAALAPGRLGRPELTLGTDPRSDPSMVAAITPFGLHVNDIPGELTQRSPMADKLAYIRDIIEPGNDVLFDGLLDGLDPVPDVERTTETIQGPAGNDITLHIARPVDTTDRARPGVLQIHGGAMVFLRATTSTYRRHRDELAAAGMIAVGVEYRKAGGVLGHHPYPAGLDDCVAALDWVHNHREQLGISHLVVSGDSGGANLALATTLKAKRLGRLHQIDGVYAMVPYISGAAAWDQARRARELPSWIETNGYFYCAENVEMLVSVYDPDGTHAENPLAWPYFATSEDLHGLPPHVISVCELDPVRDEGLAYFRNLVHAGVDATAITLHGVCHVADLMLRSQIPRLYASTVDNIARFAAHVDPTHAGVTAAV